MSTTANAPTTFSSVHLRERDKIIREKHDKELSVLHSKINRLRYSNDDLRKQIYDVEGRATRLSHALGFDDFVDAQVFISTTDQGVSYKECFEQVDFLRTELEAANSKVERLRAQIALGDQEREELKAKLDASNELEQRARKSSGSETATLKCERFELQQQYDNLRKKYDRATELYKADYKKWRNFHAWLFSEYDDDKNMNSENICTTAAVVLRKRKLQEMLDDGGLSNDKDSPPLGGLTNPYLEEDEDQMATRVVQNIKPRPFPVSPLLLSSSPTRLDTPALLNKSAAAIPKPFIRPKKANNAPLHSPSVFLDPMTGPKSAATRGSVVYKSIPDVVPRVKEPESSPSRAGTIEQNCKENDAYRDKVFFPFSETEDSRDYESRPSAFKTAKVLSLSCSSDTEQDIDPPLQLHDVPRSTTSQLKATKIPTLDFSSDTEPDTQRTESPIPLPTPSFSLPPVFKIPKVPQLTRSSDTEHDTRQASSPLQQHKLPLPTPKSLARRKYNTSNDADKEPTERPHKIRRVDGMQTPKHSFSSYRSKTSPRSGSSRKAEAERHMTHYCTSQSSRRCKNRENKENAMLLAVSTPATSAKVSNMPLQDSSAFKGRGRYANANSAAKTINAAYVIDSSRNGGVDHPYDEVVRRKEDRKKMNAGDCECCHEYYEAIGPMPSLMRPPLWRSPESKKKEKGPLRSAGQHKRNVSDSHALLTDSKMRCSLNDLQDSSFSQFESNTNKHHRVIEDHKRMISRHRHHWDRAVTPPGYWDIGFPNTQETEKINEKAKEMHRRKEVEVDRSVRAGEGKYRKR